MSAWLWQFGIPNSIVYIRSWMSVKQSDAVVWMLTCCTHRILSSRSDKCLQPVEASKTEQLNMRRPEDGTDMRRNAQETNGT
jgi:hypothetical protein